MKTTILNGLICGVLLLAAGGSSLYAQNYSIGWYKIAGGGGVSTAGTYSVSGTIGQHDATAQALNGGSYSLTGGFWAFLGLVQTAGLPPISISPVQGNSVVVSWPNTGSYSLVTNGNLSSTDWIAYGGSVTTANGTNSVSITPLSRTLFFRLRSQ